MKTRTLPPLRVTPELRRAAESVLAEGETLSAFILDSVARNVEARSAPWKRAAPASSCFGRLHFPAGRRWRTTPSCGSS